jgi:hypothetical protein
VSTKSKQPGPLAVALGYIDRGYSPIPVPYRSRKAIIEGWPDLRLTRDTAPQYFNGQPQNIGVLLGSASNELQDTDIDHPLARLLAPSFLPPTGAIFGRKTNPDSHWLYRVSDGVGPRITFEDAEGMIVEFRGDGCQTVFPGSTHEDTGEAIEWSKDGRPAEIDRALLLRKVGALAAATLIAKRWHEHSHDDLCTAVVGSMLRAGAPTTAVEHFITSICKAVGDDKVRKRTEKIARFAASLNDEQQLRHVPGWPTLEKLTDRETVKRFRKWLGIEDDAISVRPGQLHDAVDAAIEVLAGNVAQLAIYRRGKLLVRPFEVERLGFPDALGAPEVVRSLELVPITLTTLKVALTRSASWAAVRGTKGGGAVSLRVDCPLDVARGVFEAPDVWTPVPAIDAVAQVPIFDGRTLHSAPGLRNSTWINAPAGVRLSDPLTREAAQAALGRVLDLLQEFPFFDERDRATAAALLLTATLRPSLGLAPGFMLNKPSYGAGATTLAKLAGIIATGGLPPVLNANAGEKELDKLIGATLLQGRSVLIFDNLREGEPLRSSLLAQVLSDRSVVIRELGHSKEHEVDGGALVIMTGVNVTTADDLNRRVVHCVLDPKCEHPEGRVFTRPTLLRDVQRNRVAVLSDLFTITAAYLASGETARAEALAGFDQWVRWVAQPLVWLSMPDVGASAREATFGDPTNEILRALLPCIERLQRRPEHARKRGVSVADMLMPHGALDQPANQKHRDDRVVRDAAWVALRNQMHRLLAEATGAREFNGEPQFNSKTIGTWFARIAGRVVNGQRLVRAKDTRLGHQWTVETLQPVDREARTGGES